MLFVEVLSGAVKKKAVLFQQRPVTFICILHDAAFYRMNTWQTVTIEGHIFLVSLVVLELQLSQRMRHVCGQMDGISYRLLRKWMTTGLL